MEKFQQKMVARMRGGEEALAQNKKITEIRFNQRCAIARKAGFQNQ